MNLADNVRKAAEGLRERVLKYNQTTLHPIYQADLQNLAAQLDDLAARIVDRNNLPGAPTALTPSGKHETYLLEVTPGELIELYANAHLVSEPAATLLQRLRDALLDHKD